MQFRKKPVVIEAVQFIGQDIPGVRVVRPVPGDGPPCGFIQTLEGEMRADVGDWIITGIAGEKYPCKDAIFAATYQSLDEQPAPPPQWMAQLSERENIQIAHARAYAQSFSDAGVPGHNQFVLIARMAKLLDEHEIQGASEHA